MEKKYKRNHKALPTASWCPQILTGLSLQSTGMAPCCEFEGPTIQANSIEEYKQSALYKSLIEKMNKGEFHPSCWRCKEREDNGQESQRLKEISNQAASLNMDKSNIDYNKFYEVYKSDQYLWLNLQPTNKCNQSCIMCGPMCSSKMEEEVKNNPNKHWFDHIPKFHIYEDINKLAQHRHPNGRIYLSGGEPSIMKDVISYLDSIKNPHEIQIDFNSNFQSWNPKFWEILSRFKKLNILASIDGIGDTAEYHRYLSKWNIVERNVLKVKELLPQADLKISPTWTMFNIWKLGDLATWCEKHDFDSCIGNIALNKEQSIAFIHPDYRKTIKDIFDKSYWARDIRVKPEFDELHSTIDSSKFTKDSFVNLCEFVQTVDSIRGTDYKKTFPELHHYIQDVKRKLT